jgi:transposase
MRTPGSAAALERVRLIAANMFDQGLTTGQVAASLSVDGQTVRRWRRAYDARGREGLRSRPHPGGRRRLTDAQRGRLCEMLLKTPAECGFDKYLWTTGLIAELIRREFGVDYHHDYVGTMLGDMGFTHQKPARRSKERDEARIEAWRREHWPALLKKVPTPPAGAGAGAGAGA